MPNGKNGDKRHDVTNADIAVLNHARTMLIHAAELRTKNFNYFLILTGIIILAFTRIEHIFAIQVIASIGIVISGVFIILDFRTKQLIKDARYPLYETEKRFGMTIHYDDRLRDVNRKIKASGRVRIISHTFGFQAVFVVVCILFAWITFLGAHYFMHN